MHTDIVLSRRRVLQHQRVEVTLNDGEKFEHLTRFSPETKENPLGTEAMNAKARALIAPILGKDRVEKLISEIDNVERGSSIRALTPLFAD